MVQTDAVYTHDSLYQFYNSIYPFKEIAQWLSRNKSKDYFSNREWSFTTESGIYMRYRSFNDFMDLKKTILDLVPSKIDIGAIYNTQPRSRKTIAHDSLVPLEKEFVIDIDLTDYDAIRTCCKEGDVHRHRVERCGRCFSYCSYYISDRIAKDCFGFSQVLWVFSGRRGVHCWVSDDSAMKLSSPSRRTIAEFINIHNRPRLGKQFHPSIQKIYEDFLKPYFLSDMISDMDLLYSPENWGKILSMVGDANVVATCREKWTDKSLTPLQRWRILCKAASKREKEIKNTSLSTLERDIITTLTYPRIDINVSASIGHLLKSPFCVHPKTRKVSVVIDIQQLDKFDPTTVPTLETIIQEFKECKGPRHDPEWNAFPGTGERRATSKNTHSISPYLRIFKDFLSKVRKDNEVELERSTSF